jgi:hypothetical protein
MLVDDTESVRNSGVCVGSDISTVLNERFGVFEGDCREVLKLFV